MEPPTLFKVLVLMVLTLLSQSRQGFSLFPSNLRKYRTGDSLSMEVPSLASFKHLPLSYYSLLPFCKPQEGVKDMASFDLGRLLMEDMAQNSPFRINMNENGTTVFLCNSGPLLASEVDLWKKRIDQKYYINFLLDDLPAVRYVKSQLTEFKTIGFQVGTSFFEEYNVFNHLEFKVLVHKEENINMVPDGNENGGSQAPLYTIVGFEVTPCSVRHEDHLVSNLTMYDNYTYPMWGSCVIESKEIKENESITFTYRVTFEESDKNWISRWDAYSYLDGSGVQLPSLFCSLIIIVIHSLSILNIFRTRRQNQVRPGTIDIEASVQLIRNSDGPCEFGDVFRGPNCPLLLCAATGIGVQILGTVVVSVSLAALGFLSSAPRRTLLTVMVLLYTIFSYAAGLVAARLLSKIRQSNSYGWIPISLGVACMFPFIALLIFTSEKFLLETETTTSFNQLAILIILWLGISLPLTLIGGYNGSKSNHKGTSPTINETLLPQSITFRLRSLFYVLLAGAISSTAFDIQQSHILFSLEKDFCYNSYGSLWIAMALLLVICSGLSILVVHKNFLLGNPKWWWNSFFASASVAIYFFAYLIYHLVYYDIMFMKGPVAVYIGYVVLISFATMLATGSAGALTNSARPDSCRHSGSCNMCLTK